MCWICESWIEVNLSVDLNALNIPYEKPSNPQQAIQVFVHFDFDDYQPDLMTDLHLNNHPERMGKFQLHRLLPQTTVLFFFSINGLPFLTNNFQSVPVDFNIQQEVMKTFLNKKLRFALSNTDHLQEFVQEEMNVLVA